MGRSLGTTVPATKRQLKPNNEFIRKKDRKLKEVQKRNYVTRHRTSESTNLEPGDDVWILDKKEPGLIEQEVGPRSYSLRTSTGTIRRNRRSLNQLPPDQNEQLLNKFV